MIVWEPVARTRAGGLHTIYVAPAKEDPSATVSDWVDRDGNPITFPVIFRGGKAEVSDSLGRFLIDKKLAKKSRPLLAA
jgi:hypothetical protein